MLRLDGGLKSFSGKSEKNSSASEGLGERNSSTGTSSGSSISMFWSSSLRGEIGMFSLTRKSGEGGGGGGMGEEGLIVGGQVSEIIQLNNCIISSRIRSAWVGVIMRLCRIWKGQIYIYIYRQWYASLHPS